MIYVRNWNRLQLADQLVELIVCSFNNVPPKWISNKDDFLPIIYESRRLSVTRSHNAIFFQHFLQVQELIYLS